VLLSNISHSSIGHEFISCLSSPLDHVESLVEGQLGWAYIASKLILGYLACRSGARAYNLFVAVIQNAQTLASVLNHLLFYLF
jgi:hypothetical protein